MPPKSEKPTRRPRRPKRISGTEADLRLKLWSAICDADLALRKADDDSTRLRCVSALSTASAVYLRVIEAEAQADRRALRLVSWEEALELVDVVLQASRDVTDKPTMDEIVRAVRPQLEAFFNRDP